MNEMKSYRAKERTEMEVHTTTLLFQAPKNSFWELRSHSKRKEKLKDSLTGHCENLFD